MTQPSLLTDNQVPRDVLERINTRYGTKIYHPTRRGDPPKLTYAYPQILKAWWGDGHPEALRDELQTMIDGWEQTPPDKPRSHYFGENAVCLEARVLYPEYIICDDEGNPAKSFHVSDYCSHFSVAMLLQIYWGVFAEMGLISKWGKMNFLDYFGFGRVSASHVLALDYQSETRQERLLHDQDTKELRPFTERIYLSLLERRMASRQPDAGIIFHMHNVFESDAHETGAWAHRANFHSVAAPDIALAATNTFSGSV